MSLVKWKTYFWINYDNKLIAKDSYSKKLSNTSTINYAEIITEITKANSEPFDGGFDYKCKETYVTPSIKALITKALWGQNIKITNNPFFNQPVLIIFFN